ncbi:VOC family protein [Lutimonas sp.]|uniref:VOC family protein n=1 Tax=Lutimonas sp. TaxID=1872403 RepID=UPI003D9B213A
MKLINNYINYVELKANDLHKIKSFYSGVFNWKFTDYGPDYTAFSESGIAGGFEKTATPVVKGALIVLYHEDLNLIQHKIIGSGGRITKEIFSFPGGQRFHFEDPSGNELAIWSEN